MRKFTGSDEDSKSPFNEESKSSILKHDNIIEAVNDTEQDFVALETPAPYIPSSEALEGLDSIRVTVKNIPQSSNLGRTINSPNAENYISLLGEAVEQPPEKDRELHYLKYGDRIKLVVLKDGTTFRLFSDGFATRHVFLNHRASLQSSNEVFRVIPRADSAQFTKLRRDLKLLMKTNEKAGDKGYRRLIEEEVERTLVRSKKLLGQPVRYRQSVQFVHEETKQFLAVSRNVDLSDKRLEESKVKGGLNILVKEGISKDIMRAYSLKLKSHSNTKTHFMLAPCHGYQETGYVLRDDSFYFAYMDPKLLGKCFHLYFPALGLETSLVDSYNVYLYEKFMTAVKYEPVSKWRFERHLFRELDRQAIWITHIEAPVFLCLEKIEKTTGPSENGLGELIEGIADAIPYNFCLAFRKYDEGDPCLSPKGMWTITACSEDPSMVSFKHLLYDVWLKPLIAENIVRNEAQRDCLNHGSVFKIRLRNSKEFVSVGSSLLSSATDSDAGSLATLSNTSDYASCFKVVKATERERLQSYAIAHLSRFIQSYDEQTMRKVYDFNPEALFETLSRALNCMKHLCLNSYPPVYNSQLPYKVPSKDVQWLLREAKSIDALAALLLKLFPAGASGDYKDSPKKTKVLGKLLGLLAMAVKGNKKNQIYTFDCAVRIIQKYIGLHLPKKQEDQALLAVIENCDEILLDLSLEQIINQFIRELAVSFG